MSKTLSSPNRSDTVPLIVANPAKADTAGQMTDGVQYFLWGVAGGAIVDGLEFVKRLQASKNKLPKGYVTPWFVVGELIRLSAGGGLAAALYLSGEIAKPVAGIMVGVAAPTIIERWTREPPKLGT